MQTGSVVTMCGASTKPLWSNGPACASGGKKVKTAFEGAKMCAIGVLRAIGRERDADRPKV